MTIYGIGTDIVSIARISRLFQLYDKRFMKRVLHFEEITTFNEKKEISDQAAMCFLAGRY